ncbi:hypothetical protein KFE80_06510 [bacterium SCSIO 12696]|nr:hypothetical protein KFE80_06510 [bacterium SCSIO 12696]
MGRVVIAALFVLAGLVANTVLAADETPLPPDTITLHGYQYQLALEENKNLQVQFSSPSEARHYRGQLVGQPQSWVRLSEIDGHWQGVLSIAGEAYVIDVPPVALAHKEAHSVAHSYLMNAEPISSSPPVACGLDHSKKSQPQIAEAAIEPAHSALQLPQAATFSSLCQNRVDDGAGGQVCLLAEMEFAFDQAFQSEFGANARAQAESLINIVEGFYRNDFGIIFDTITLELISGTVFSTTTLASEDEDGNPGLLDDIQDKKQNDQIPFIQNDRALFHLVTGRNFDGSTAGVAFVGVLCNRFGFSSGTSQVLRRFNGTPNLPLTALVVAHEIGHNFGASHDSEGNSCSSSGFIMAASVSGSATGFSSCSQDSITAEISSVSDNLLPSCFNFPADIAIAASSANPSSAVIGNEAVLEYSVSVSNASRNVAGVRVAGSVPASQGRFNTVELSGQSCTVAGDGLSFSCNVNAPASSLTLISRVVPSTDNATFTYQAESTGDDQIVDINNANNQVQTALAATGAVTPPVAASGLSASQGSGTVVDLSWSDNSDDESSFRIERRVGGGSFSSLATVAANSTSFSDNTSVAGINYGYRIFAVNSGGNSNASNEATITPVEPVPLAPSRLSATLGASSNVDLSWADNSDNESGFRVERRIGSGSFSVLTTVAANSVRFSDTTAEAGTDYGYRVIAINSGGDSVPTTEATISVPELLPAAPSGLSASLGSGNNVALSWVDNSNNEDNFRIERRVGTGAFSTLATVAANTTAFTDTSTAQNTSYSYRVVSLNSAGDSAASNVTNITTPAPIPPAPTPAPAPAPPASSGGGGAFGWLMFFLVPLLWLNRQRGYRL